MTNEVLIKSSKLSKTSAADAFISRTTKTYHISLPVRCGGGRGGSGGEWWGVYPFPTKLQVFRLYTIHIFISTRRLALNGIETFSSVAKISKKILLLCLVVDIVFVFSSLKTINLHFRLSVSGIIVLFRQINAISDKGKNVKMKCIRFLQCISVISKRCSSVWSWK